LVIACEPLEIQEGLTYKEVLVQILDRKEQVLCTKTIPIVKALWRNHGVEEASGEAEMDMSNHYPHLFEESSCMNYLKIFLHFGLSGKD
jgi:hypothetical protein